MKRWRQASEAKENQANFLQPIHGTRNRLLPKKEYYPFPPVIQICVSYANLQDTNRLFRRLSQLLSSEH